MRKLSAFTVVVLVAAVSVLAYVQAVSAKGGKVVHSATGSGHVTSSGAFRSFSFSAREYADATDRGQAQLRNRGSTNTPIHVQITCLNVVGNVAHVTGFVKRIRKETPPFFVMNSRVAFSVADNGQTGDLISLMSFFGVGTPLSCTTPLTTPTLPVEKGQVKVR